MEIEICVERLETALVADNLGANRIELCSALDLGGLTPSAGMIQSCVDNCSLDIFVMIRPRGGGFVYDSREIEAMKNDIVLAESIGAQGVVFGCLTKGNDLDDYNNSLLLDIAKSKGLGVTFHRAIDFCQSPVDAIGNLINQGFDRILTSGQAKTAIEGIENIAHWKKNYGDKIQIMAGSGVNKTNAFQLKNTGIGALHFTARKKVSLNNDLKMGINYSADEEKILSILNEIK